MGSGDSLRCSAEPEEGFPVVFTIVVVLCLLTPPAAQVAPADPVLIEDVPKVGWRARQFNLPISALTAALQTMGCKATYEELMVASGAAFSTVWEAGHSWKVVVTAAPEDFVVNGAAAVGAEAERRAFDSEEQLRTALRESIDEQRRIVADLEHRNALEPDDVCFSPDGQRIAFSARVWDWDPERPPATLIWTSALDGSDLKQITPWDDSPVPLAGG